MKTRSQIIAAIGEQGILPLFYHEDITVCKGIVDALYQAGIRVIEFTNRGPAALHNFRSLVQLRESSWPGLLFGAGTIKTVTDTMAFLGAGADFLISPAFFTAIAEIAEQESFTWIPGCTTPTEIATAEQYGINAVKLFPGSLLGPAYVTAIRDIFPHISFMPTGGVTQEADNLKQWFASGVFAVGLGSQLVSKELLLEKNYARIGADTANVMALVKAIRNPAG
jgi:2-dehydro-3-deoxyphosphogluconate aldolase / (4S)-4-hydroxy-2-oxoglutarate aldolase